MSSTENINDRDTLGWTKLHNAAANGDVIEVQRLVVVGVDVKAPTSTGKTSLHIASHNGHFGVVRVLLDNSADVNAQDDYGYFDSFLSVLFLFLYSFE